MSPLAAHATGALITSTVRNAAYAPWPGQARARPSAEPGQVQARSRETVREEIQRDQRPVSSAQPQSGASSPGKHDLVALEQQQQGSGRLLAGAKSDVMKHYRAR